ncbi:hypothetical protein CsSME_00039320 [Camellia sinensis var. sinensis]
MMTMTMMMAVIVVCLLCPNLHLLTTKGERTNLVFPRSIITYLSSLIDQHTTVKHARASNGP